MVNYGVSGGCLTCKTRRIKCDEQRPTCQKCAKSRRTCLGYKDDADIIFRDSTSSSVNDPIEDHNLSSPSSQTSKSLNTSINLPDADENSEVAAMKMFFLDYVLVSKDRSLSRGYFDGLESLLNHASPDSELVSAATIVALASAASKAGSYDLVSSSARYPDAIAAFQKTLDNPDKSNADEALMTATLLGLYEMIVAGEAYPIAHGMHVKGVSAILCTRKLPFDLLALTGSSLFELLNPLLPRRPPLNGQVPGLLSPYSCSEADPPTKSLDVLLIKLRPIRERASQILSSPKASKEDLRILKQEASLLNKEFSLWPLCQPKEWMPQTLGTIKETAQSTDDSLHMMPFWPGNINSYFDLYVVAVWNIYRKARLKLIDAIVESSERLHPSDGPNDELATIRKLKNEMQELVDDLCASVPFHLVADLPSYLQAGNTSGDVDSPGKALGGLLLMYPLYVASSLSLVPLKQRIWMRGRLRWIGKHMGIRQATMLADVCLIIIVI